MLNLRDHIDIYAKNVFDQLKIRGAKENCNISKTKWWLLCRTVVYNFFGAEDPVLDRSAF